MGGVTRRKQDNQCQDDEAHDEGSQEDDEEFPEEILVRSFWRGRMGTGLVNGTERARWQERGSL